jgi:hypothetical protein
MASLEERLRKIRGRISPPPPDPSPATDLLLKMANHYRSELDHADRVHDAQGRGRLEAGEPPEPLSLSLDEKRELVEDQDWWQDYLASEQERAPEALAAVITDAITTSRESAERLREEIEVQEAIEGSTEHEGST